MIVNQKWDSTNDETNKLNYLFESSSLLPSDLINYPNQIGGHGLLFGNKCKILYSHVQSTIYKPIQHYPKGPHELEFYQRLFDPNCNDSVLVELRKFVPDFYGLYRDSEQKHLYLGLKDLLANFKHPSLCDLKMGRRTYAPDSSPSKIMIECAKYKWREEIGFLVTGLKVFYPDLNEYTTFDIFFGRSLNPSTIYDNGIRLFLGPDINRAKRLANQFVKKLTQLAKWFENQNCYHFYASSLLLAYDSVDANDEIMPSPNTTTTTTTTTTQLPYSYYHHDHDHHHSCQDNNKESIISNIDNNEADEYVLVYLIDFTRWELVTDCSQIKDENFLYGLNYLIELFQRASLDSSPLT
ncbi:unnamed protein product [Schistosoma curassoni]|nr:unnamed protein product [Schistosoma curassoni]